MVKGISRRVVVVESPDPRIFEQAIFIVRNDALSSGGVSSQEIVDEARRVAKSYTQGSGHLSHRWRALCRLCTRAWVPAALALCGCW